MSEYPKKNSPRQLFRGGMKNKKIQCDDIVTQAENVVTDYIYKRKNEIINKYCKKRSGFGRFLVLMAFPLAMLALCFVLKRVM